VRLGITAALTDRDLAPAVLAVAVEERGFDSLWLPEHTHLPVREDTPPALVEGVRVDDYKRCLDPLVGLATSAAVTSRIGLGTGILLAAQHDPILLAKQVATLDHLSGGRVSLGVGFGWNRAEAEDHGVNFARRHDVVDEHLGAIGGRGLGEALPRLRSCLEAAGRDPGEACVVPFGTIADEGKLEHYARLGVDEVVLRIRAGAEPAVRAELDALAPLVPFAATLEQP